MNPQLVERLAVAVLLITTCTATTLAVVYRNDSARLRAEVRSAPACPAAAMPARLREKTT